MTHVEQVPPKLRAVVYARDEGCLVCGSRDMTVQRRQTTGMGGSHVRLLPSEVLCLCMVHNEGAESWMQTEALMWGLKVRRNIGRTPLRAVPVYSNLAQAWYRLDDDGSAEFLRADIALDLMRAVYGQEFDEWRTAVLDLGAVR